MGVYYSVDQYQIGIWSIWFVMLFCRNNSVFFNNENLEKCQGLILGHWGLTLWSTHTEGKVINVQGKFYTVNAPTEKEAQELAKAQFIDEYGYNGEIYTSEARKLNKFTGISMVSMIMAILLSFINWKLDHSTVSIKPDLISCIMAFAIYLRDYREWPVI